jgi:hypothetical protein
MKIFSLLVIYFSLVVIAGTSSFSDDDRKSIKKIVNDVETLHCDDLQQRLQRHTNIQEEKLDFLIANVMDNKATIAAIRTELFAFRSEAEQRFSKLEAVAPSNGWKTGRNLFIYMFQIVLANQAGKLVDYLRERVSRGVGRLTLCV